MKSFPVPSDPAAGEQAALWAARLDGSVLTAAQRIALDAWLEASPAHRVLLSNYCQFSADLEQQLPLIAGIREMSAGELAAPEIAQPLPWLRWPLMAGATLTAAAAIALVFWLARPQPQFTSLATPVASRQALTLADGTRIELNAQTSLSAEISPKVRHVRLASGEAFFAVHKDPSRPFVIETPAGSVQVTGTQFDVRAESAVTLEVTVAEGSVQVAPAGAEKPVTLTIGRKLSATDGHVAVQSLSATDLDNALAWRQGQIVFNGVPLSEAVARFARYHGRGLTVAPEIAGLRVGARYSLDDLEGFFAALEDTLPVKVTHNPNGTVQVEPRAGQ
ncbi:MAG: FecR family protein [Lacunisphaera sp.]|nr:FecR family protein [Lacunisphaera sp.]